MSNSYVGNSNCLASFVLFRELYDNKKDVYDVISKFLNEVIISGKNEFNLTEITQLLNETYNFSIPEAVVKTALKRLPLEKSNHLYRKSTLSEDNKVSTKYRKAVENNNYIIRELIEYIEERKEVRLGSEERKKIESAFCDYLLDNPTDSNYLENISASIIKNEKNRDFVESIETIREGIILYSGLKYSPDMRSVGSWNTDLNIYLGTDILFSMMGYNNKLHQSLFDDFFSLVNEINIHSQNKSRTNKIHLKYFIDTRNEVENFFSKADYIIRREDTLDPFKDAMTNIIDGCNNPSDILIKKTQFYIELERRGIKLDERSNCYNQENFKFNIEDREIIDHIQDNTEDKSILSNYLKYLNYINILRQGDSKNSLENIKFIFLTNNRALLEIAWNEEIKECGSIPLATSLSFLTDKFWFKLNKGFGDNGYPKSFSVITKAQIVLSSVLNRAIINKYNKVKKQFEEKIITKDEVISYIVELKKNVKKAEEINQDDVDNVLDVIQEDSIEKHIIEEKYISEMLKKETKEKEEALKKNEDMYIENRRDKKALREAKEEIAKYKKEEEQKEKILKIIKSTLWIVFFICGAIGVIHVFYNINVLIGLLSSIVLFILFCFVWKIKPKKIITYILNNKIKAIVWLITFLIIAVLYLSGHEMTKGFNGILINFK